MLDDLLLFRYYVTMKDTNNKLRDAFASEAKDLAFDDLRREAALRSEDTDFVIPRDYIIQPDRFAGLKPVINQLISNGRQPRI